MLCQKPRDAMLTLKKLSTLFETRDLKAGAIFGSVAKHPQNISFLRSISHSMDSIYTRKLSSVPRIHRKCFE